LTLKLIWNTGIYIYSVIFSLRLGKLESVVCQQNI